MANYDPAAKLADSVTIYRDEFGIPHVSGDSDAATFFGSGYAQAEDNLAAVERNCLRVLGRTAELYGDAALPGDLVARALGLARLAQSEYRKVCPTVRELCRAFAAGLNYYAAEGHRPLSVLKKFEPWHVLAIYRVLHLAAFYATGFNSGEIFTAVRGPDAAPSQVRLLHFQRPGGFLEGSNAWAVGPKKSASGNSMLLSSPHVEFGNLYEMHLHSEQGLNFSGTGSWGMPMPALGVNSALGWSLTVNNPPISDVYIEAFEDQRDPLAYRYGNGKRRAVEWAEDVPIRFGRGIETRRYFFRRTHHGPIVSVREGKQLSVRIAKLAEGGMLEQFLEMAKAESLEQFKTAVDRRALIFHNIVYADCSGNIYYVYNGAIPRRQSAPANIGTPIKVMRKSAGDANDSGGRGRTRGFRALEGSDPRTEWRGYYALDELPQVENPACGFVQSCNSNPFLATGNELFPLGSLPLSMVDEPDTARARASRQVLSLREKIALDDLAQMAFDTYVLEAARLIPLIVKEYRSFQRKQPNRAALIAPAASVLARWDCKSTSASVAMTLFTFWSEDWQQLVRQEVHEWRAATALERTVARLIESWGTWRVPWGEVNRLQRTTGVGGFSDAEPSLPIPGGPGWMGILFTFGTARHGRQRRRYGVHGNSLVSVAEFGRPVRALSVSVFGQSANPASPHYFDQAPLYAASEMKPISLQMQEIKLHARHTYRPAARRAAR